MEAKLRLFAASQDPVPDLLWSYLSRQEASRALLKIREKWKSALREGWGKAANYLCFLHLSYHPAWEDPIVWSWTGKLF